MRLLTFLLVSGLILVTKSTTLAQVPVESDRSRNDSTHVFSLGEVEIVGSIETVGQRLAERLTSGHLQSAWRMDLSEILPGVPGIVLQRIGPRNEAGLRLRGFDLRHVPIFVDGIPLSTPYDGFVDLARFVTSDLSRITVAKGFSSLLFGPNALAGAVNMVGRTPSSRLEGSIQTGWRSPSGREASAAVGTRQRQWFALANLSYLAQESFSLSDSFNPTPTENGGRRENASREDVRLSAKIGLTPSDNATYAIGYVNQQGEKENPPYAGPPGEFRVRYWDWPKWDKESVYLLADQLVGEAFHLRGRVYYDQFASALFSYDDATFSNQTKPFSFQTFNDDDSYGGNILLRTTVLSGHTLGVAVHLKRDQHRERNQNEAIGRYEDLTWSMSIEDEFALGAKSRVVAGLMYSRRRGDRAERFDLEEIFPLIEKGSLEGQIAVQHVVSNVGHLFVSVGRRTRFPTIKDRYSYREGRALPNPFLEPERALNLGAGYDGVLLPVIQIRAELFYAHISDVIQTGEIVDLTSGRRLAQLQNAGRARHVGGEATLRFQVMSWLRGESSYAYVHLKNLEDANLLFTHTPSHSFRAYLEATSSSKLALRGWITHNSSRFTRIEGTSLTELDGYVSVDVEGAFHLQPGTQFRVGIRNIMDANYEIVAGYPEPGRSLFAKMSYTILR